MSGPEHWFEPVAVCSWWHTLPAAFLVRVAWTTDQKPEGFPVAPPVELIG